MAENDVYHLLSYLQECQCTQKMVNVGPADWPFTIFWVNRWT